MDITDALEKDDHTTMLVYADWLEDEGRSDEAEAWRYVGTQELAPFRDGSAGLKVQHSHDWWNDDNRSKSSKLPKALFASLEGGYKSKNAYDVIGNFCEYPTRQRAYEALVVAFITAGKKGWSPLVISQQSDT